MKEIHFQEPNEIIQFLRLNNERWIQGKDWDSPWLFRGQKNSQWGLLPSLLRSYKPKYLESLIEQFRTLATKKVDEQYNLGFKPQSGIEPRHRTNLIEATSLALAERAILDRFTEEADKQGYKLFMNSKVYGFDSIFQALGRNQKVSVGGSGATGFIAQHHGIPTRHLDWTKNPLIALFFASCDIDPFTDDQKLAVYAIDTSKLKENIGNQEIDTKCKFWVHEVQKNMIKFLQAQQGTFTIMSGSGDFYYIENGKWPEIPEYMEILQNQYERNNFYKLTIDQNKAGEILRLLRLEGISYASLMPNLDNVTKSVFNRLKWEIKGNSI